MYSIKQASLRSGVGVPLIRAWERRYGVVSPERTASGYRLYDDDAIATLIRVRELTEDGWTASEASRAVLAGEVEVPRGGPAAVTTLLAGEDAPSRRADLVDRFMAAATRMDMAATGAVLDEILAQGSFEAIVDELLMPALAALGQAWSEGLLDIAAEHAASAAVHRRLSALYEAAAAPGDAAVIVGLPPGARHELGALAFSVALRRRGVGVLYLGPDVPVASWVHAIEQNRARAAIIAVVQEADQAAAAAVAAGVKALGGRTAVAVGGKSAGGVANHETGIVVLPERINEAVGVAAGLAAETKSTR